MRLISIAQAAAMLSIGRTTAYALAKAGKIPCVRGFGPLRIHYDKLVQMIEAGIPDTLADAGGVQDKENVCPTREEKFGGSATPQQMARTLDALLAPKIIQQPRP
ncbi:helix-turn-helix domain-containing protein [Pseudomonas gingeri]|uniref:helix-turn-helix domain-containing protein n=1 Tax=Pseudomonas gingeri TaxID=117681 RepID=UPI0015A48A77|nr:helix-turn-helix domain-containing protein [Pseudomonas gingeri]NWE46377.1 helix-turn-helix domain-containing protein [Pseudomonas gingeri]